MHDAPQEIERDRVSVGKEETRESEMNKLINSVGSKLWYEK